MIKYSMDFVNDLIDELNYIKTPHNIEFVNKIFSVVIVCVSFTLLFECINYIWLKILVVIYSIGQ